MTDCKCATPASHELVLRAKENCDEQTIVKMSEFLKVLAAPTRLKIASCLLAGEMCVCTLSELLETEQSAVSHHLAVMRTANVVRVKKQGKESLYSLSDDHVKCLIGLTRAHATHTTEGL
jgi:DNA-binding transcriptional ArsR family regulator